MGPFLWGRGNCVCSGFCSSKVQCRLGRQYASAPAGGFFLYKFGFLIKSTHYRGAPGSGLL